MLIAGGIARPLEDPILKLLKTEQFSYEMLDATGLKWAEIDTQEDYSNALKVFERSQ
jgi:choline kinase